MNLYEIYFSPTGGVKKVADIICDTLQWQKTEIDLLLAEASGREGTDCEFTPQDVCVVAVPSFGGRVPEPALNQLRRMRGEGTGAILAAVYGNRDYEDTLVELKDTLDGAGFAPIAAIAAVAEHSIVHKFGEGRPDSGDRRELERFAVRIKDRLESGAVDAELCIPGNHSYKDYHGIPLSPKANQNCVKCGLCAAECPGHAIPVENPSTVLKKKCISCMHCIAVCPKNARSNDKILISMIEKKIEKSCRERKGNQLFL